MTEIRFRTFNTRRNLPSGTGRRRGEANFMAAFLRSFVNAAEQDQVIGRQFAVPDCGVADCIALQTSDGADETQLIAFEAKLSDWKRALTQAYRYRYYADLSVVVMPVETAKAAVQNRHLFKQLGVALWTFDQSSGAINRKVSPRRTTPLSPRKREQALLRLERGFPQLRKPRKEA